MRVLFLALIAALTFVIPGAAADLPNVKPSPPILPPLIASTFQPFQLRVKIGSMIPLDGVATLHHNGTIYPQLAPVWAATGAIPGASRSISPSIMPVVDFAYYLNRNWAIELTCCASPHRVNEIETLTGGAVTRALIFVFPPSLTLQYHFTQFGNIQPYLGVGVNYTHVLIPATLPRTYGFPGIGGEFTAYSVGVSPSWGAVGQAGVDYMFDNNWGVNFDVKYMMMNPKAHIPGTLFMWGGAGNTPFSVPLEIDMKVNPIVVSAGLTYRFGGDWDVPKLLPF